MNNNNNNNNNSIMYLCCTVKITKRKLSYNGHISKNHAKKLHSKKNCTPSINTKSFAMLSKRKLIKVMVRLNIFH